MRRAGFTLVELSIVLVIIGLIVGGVLVGADLVKGAEVRKIISDVEKYKTAAMVFKGKYGALPGDLKGAAGYGFPSASLRTGATARSDGDGIVGSGSNSVADLQLGFETAWFWRDLKYVGMTSDGVDTLTTSTMHQCWIPMTSASSSFPKWARDI